MMIRARERSDWALVLMLRKKLENWKCAFLNWICWASAPAAVVDWLRRALSTQMSENLNLSSGYAIYLSIKYTFEWSTDDNLAVL